MRLCLVRPPVVTATRSLSYYGAVPDLGLAYVAAAARDAGHHVTVIDAPGEALDRFEPLHTAVGTFSAQGLSLAAIVERIPDEVDVIGFAHMFLHEWPLLRALIRHARRARPRARLVAGGENATAYWREMLGECRALDACVLGEGELAIVALLEAIGTDKPLRTVPSLGLRVGDRLVETSRAPRIAELDALPRPAWDLFPLEAYLERRCQGGVDRGRSLPLLTSRGCPYRCTFCSSPSMWTTRYVRRDPERVLDEIEWLVDTWKVDNVDLHDLTAMLTKRWILEFCKRKRARGVAVTWQLPSGTRSEAVDREAAQAMVAAGCRNFCYAPESGSIDELKRIGKRVDLEALVASLREAVDAGMRTHASIIVGLPGAQPSDIWATSRFVLRLARVGLHTLSVMVFSPYPGSAEYERLRARSDFERDERWIYGTLLRSAGGLRSYDTCLGPRSLAALQLGLLGSFFASSFARRPARMVETVRHAIGGHQETVLDQLVATKAKQFGRAWSSAE